MNTRPTLTGVGTVLLWAALLGLATVLACATITAAAYLVLMTGLILAALVALTCPRADGDEEFVTLGLYTVAQCTPSRANTLTGRGSS